MRFRALAATILVLVVSSPALAQAHAEYYVLDAFGGVHAGGGAPVVAPATPYFGFDVAATIEYVAVGTSVATGDGIIVLDKWGGVHYGGALAAHPPGGSPTPYFGFDATRGLVMRDPPPRLAYVTSTNNVDFSTVSANYTTLASLTIFAPTDGYLHVIGNANVNCPSGAGNNTSGFVSTNVNSTAAGPAESRGLAVIRDCQNTSGHGFPTNNQTVSTVFPVGAGTHTVNLLGRKAAGTGVFRVFSRTLTAQFVAADEAGMLNAPHVAAPSPSPSEAAMNGLGISR